MHASTALAFAQRGPRCRPDNPVRRFDHELLDPTPDFSLSDMLAYGNRSSGREAGANVQTARTIRCDRLPCR